jgi:NAD+ kinase
VKQVIVTYNPRIARALPLAGEIAAWIELNGGRAQVCPITDFPLHLCQTPAELLVTLGGDGSILRVARVAATCGTPILGINLGRVGFLTEVGPDGWQKVLTQICNGEFWIEERMMLRATVSRGGTPTRYAEALNDVVVGRGARARVVHLTISVDGGYLTTCVADGLIIATPTGSTAYALAAGGPVLSPQSRNILVVPIAPHLSMAHSLVLAEGATVQLTVAGRRPAVLTVDGEVQERLGKGDEVIIEASQHVARFARVQERNYFYKTLAERLMPKQPQVKSDE